MTIQRDCGTNYTGMGMSFQAKLNDITCLLEHVPRGLIRGRAFL